MDSENNEKRLFINDLLSLSDDDFMNKCDEIFDRLTDYIDLEDYKNVGMIFEHIFKKYNSLLSKEHLNEYIFNLLFSKVLDIINMFYEDIQSKITSDLFVSERINEKLATCTHLIKIVKNITQNLEQKFPNNNSHFYIDGLLLNNCLILCSTYKHCSNSESIYGSKIEFVYESLSNLFSVSSQLQACILSITRIEYDLTLQKHLDNFIKVFLVLVECGKFSSFLDVRTAASLWKTIYEIIEKYKTDIENYMNYENKFIVNELISFLCKHINKSLNKLYENVQDVSQSQKSIKFNNFFMKIVLKLCDLYRDYIICMPDILDMMYTVHGMSGPILKYKNIIDNELCFLIQSHIYIAVEILVGNLIENSLFIEEVLYKGKPENNFSSLFLCINILKNLISKSERVRCLWMSTNTYNIVYLIFKILNKSHYELSLNIKFTGVALEGKAPTECDLYKLLISYVGGFILSAGCQEFQIIEEIILKIIIEYNNNSLWSSILASDLICLVDRYGSADLCYAHLNLFSELLVNVSALNMMYDSDFIFIKQTIARIYNLLPSGHKKRFLKEHDIISNISIFAAIGLKNLEEYDSSNLIEFCETMIIDFIEKSGAQNFMSMSNLVSLLMTADYSIRHHKSFIEQIIKIWECFKRTDYLTNRFSWESRRKSEKKNLTKFLMSLISLTSLLLQKLSNFQLITILIQLDDLVHINTSIKLQICSFLNKLHKKKIENDNYMISCFKLITKLFCSLLSDTNVIVEQKAFDAMINFSKYTIHEDLINKIGTEQNHFKQKFSAILSKEPFTNDLCTDLDAYLKSQTKNLGLLGADKEEIISSGQTDVFEIDVVDDMFEDDFEDLNPAKIQKLDTSNESNAEVQGIINNIKNSTDLLLDKKYSLTSDSKSDLLFVIDQLQSILRTL